MAAWNFPVQQEGQQPTHCSEIIVEHPLMCRETLPLKSATFGLGFKQNKIGSWDSPADVLCSWALSCRQNLSHELNTAVPYEGVIIGHVKQRGRVAVGFIMRDWLHNTNYGSPGEEATTQGFCL